MVQMKIAKEKRKAKEWIEKKGHMIMASFCHEWSVTIWVTKAKNPQFYFLHQNHAYFWILLCCKFT